MAITGLIRDWWRGFTNEDLASTLRKTEANRAGDIVWLSTADFKAWQAFNQRRGQIAVRP